MKLLRRETGRKISCFPLRLIDLSVETVKILPLFPPRTHPVTVKLRSFENDGQTLI